MKSLRIFRILTFVFIIFGAFGQNAFAAEKLTKIADGVYSYVDTKNSSPQNSYGANAGIIIGKDSIVVVDTLISSKEAKRFIRDIRAISKKSIKYVINTHYHLDHTFGNWEFAKLGAVIISHINDTNNLKAQGETALKNAKNYGLTEKDMKGTKIAYPALSFNDRLEIALSDQKIELIYIGHSHTDGSIMVYLPDKKILFAGDILFTDFHPYMADADIAGWISVLDYILTMDIAAIVPGHGPLSTKKDIKDMKQYLMTFDSIGRELSAQGKDAKYIASEILKAVPKREFFEMFVEGNVAAKYLKK